MLFEVFLSPCPSARTRRVCRPFRQNCILWTDHFLQVPVGDNYFAALNSAVFSDGSFCYIPKGVTSPMELSTYFRINSQESGQVSPLLLCRQTGK